MYLFLAVSDIIDPMTLVNTFLTEEVNIIKKGD